MEDGQDFISKHTNEWMMAAQGGSNRNANWIDPSKYYLMHCHIAEKFYCILWGTIFYQKFKIRIYFQKLWKAQVINQQQIW